MGQEDEKHDEVPELDDLDPSSGTQKKSDGADLKLLVAQFRQRTQGLTPEELEEEVHIFMNKLIERALKIAPESLRVQGRELLKGMLEDDPRYGRCSPICARVRPSPRERVADASSRTGEVALVVGGARCARPRRGTTRCHA